VREKSWGEAHIGGGKERTHEGRFHLVWGTLHFQWGSNRSKKGVSSARVMKKREKITHECTMLGRTSEGKRKKGLLGRGD